MAQKPQAFKVTNKLTGEVMEFTYGNVEEAEACYLEVKSMYDILDKARKRISAYIGEHIEDKYDFGDGYTGMWIPKNFKKYRAEIVKKYLDEDQLALVTEINPTKLKKFFEQLVEDGKGIPGAWTDIEANAEVTPGKPYFVIRRG